jgi:hypothetical protein
MSEIEPVTWLDYEGPEHTYICICGNEFVDESTATDPKTCDQFSDEYVDDGTYISLRCPDFPECFMWEVSSEELKERKWRIWNAHS